MFICIQKIKFIFNFFKDIAKPLQTRYIENLEHGNIEIILPNCIKLLCLPKCKGLFKILQRNNKLVTLLMLLTCRNLSHLFTGKKSTSPHPHVGGGGGGGRCRWFLYGPWNVLDIYFQSFCWDTKYFLMFYFRNFNFYFKGAWSTKYPN